MSAQLELYVLPWGLYPRRVLLYLAEKGLLSSPLLRITPVTITQTGMTAPGKPSGSVPILRLPDGSFIKQSLAMIEFFEDVCDSPDPSQDWQAELAKTANRQISMRGSTAEEKARTKEVLALVDEASTQFCFAAHKGTAFFVPLEKTNAAAAELAMEYCKKTLMLVEEKYAAELSRSVDRGRVSIADCVFYSLMQFSEGVYGVDLLSEPELPVLRRLRGMLRTRSWDGLEEAQCPKQIRSLASQWLPVERDT
jgi:glutathione S-transferase